MNSYFFYLHKHNYLICGICMKLYRRIIKQMIDNKQYYFTIIERELTVALLSHISLYILFLAIHKKVCTNISIALLIHFFYRTFVVAVDVEGKKI